MGAGNRLTPALNLAAYAVFIEQDASLGIAQ
jgi:hypothetical protein